MGAIGPFTGFLDVEAWAGLYGVQALRDALRDEQLDDTSAFLAQAWLRRFDACVQIALDQDIVRSRPVCRQVGARVIVGPW